MRKSIAALLISAGVLTGCAGQTTETTVAVETTVAEETTTVAEETTTVEETTTIAEETTVAEEVTTVEETTTVAEETTVAEYSAKVECDVPSDFDVSVAGKLIANTAQDNVSLTDIKERYNLYYVTYLDSEENESVGVYARHTNVWFGTKQEFVDFCDSAVQKASELCGIDFMSLERMGTRGTRDGYDVEYMDAEHDYYVAFDNNGNTLSVYDTLSDTYLYGEAE